MPEPEKPRDRWWWNTGSGMRPGPGEDTETFAERVAKASWNAARRLPIVPDCDSTLIMTVGLPRSGKSTWAMAQGVPVVNPDAIRLACHGQRFVEQAEPLVWYLAERMVDSLFLAGHRVVILDATNITRSRRDCWISTEQNSYHRRRFLCLEMEPTTCIERCPGDAELHDVIRAMHEKFQPVDSEEGPAWRFDETYEHPLPTALEIAL